MQPRRRIKTASRAALYLVACLALPFFLAILSAAARAGPFANTRYLPLLIHNWPPPPTPGRLLITEVLYHPTGDDPQGEWVEIANVGDAALLLDGFKLGDAEYAGANEGMHAFPPGVLLDAGQAFIIANRASTFKNRYGQSPDWELEETDPEVPNLSKYAAWSSRGMNLNNAGDEVILLDGRDQRADIVSWGSSSAGLDPPAKSVTEGHSLERVPADVDLDRASDWLDQPEPDPGDLNRVAPTPTVTETLEQTLTETPATAVSETSKPYTPPILLVSEVLYDPVSSEPQNEWIEIYNPGGTPADLSQCKLGDEEIPGGAEGMLIFPANALVPAGETLIVANNAVNFISEYGFPPDYEISASDPQVPDLSRYTAWSNGTLSLNNSGDEVLLLDALDHRIDGLSWGSSDIIFDPPAMDVGEGHSLARLPANRDTDAASDWHEKTDPEPGQVDLDIPSFTPTATASATPSSTPSPTPSPTSTSTPTATSTGTPTSTDTATSTVTPTPSPTSPDTPTETTTPTPTATSSATPTPSPTSTVTPTATGTSTATQTPTPTLSVGADHLLISEVYYDTYMDINEVDEWIEIYNPTSSMVDLANFKIGDEETRGGREGMYVFPAGASILPHSRLIIVYAAAAYPWPEGFSPDYEIVESDQSVPNLAPYTDWAFGRLELSNAGDEVLLLDENDLAVDVVVYEGGAYNGVTPHPGVGAGHSIERSPAEIDTDDCSVDFIDQSQPTPGEPASSTSLAQGFSLTSWLDELVATFFRLHP